jgi:hypothetical protein
LPLGFVCDIIIIPNEAYVCGLRWEGHSVALRFAFWLSFSSHGIQIFTHYKLKETELGEENHGKLQK